MPIRRFFGGRGPEQRGPDPDAAKRAAEEAARQQGLKDEKGMFARFNYTIDTDRAFDRMVIRRDEDMYEAPVSPEREGWYGDKGGRRRVINRDSRVSGGVRLMFTRDGRPIQELLVIDDEEIEGVSESDRMTLTPAQEEQRRTARPNPIDEVYGAMQNRLAQDVEQSGGAIDQGEMMRHVAFAAFSAIQYDGALIDVIREYKTGKQVHLTELIRVGKGVCTHQAALAAVMLERMIDEGNIPGAVSIDRSYIPDKGGHEWVRYTDHKDQAWVIDPAAGFVGTLEDAQRLNPEMARFYTRPEDRGEEESDRFRYSKQLSKNMDIGARVYGRAGRADLSGDSPAIDGSIMRFPNGEAIRVRVGASEHMRNLVGSYLKALDADSGESPAALAAKIARQAIPLPGKSGGDLRLIRREADSTGMTDLGQYVEARVGSLSAQAALSVALLEQARGYGFMEGSYRIHQRRQEGYGDDHFAIEVETASSGRNEVIDFNAEIFGEASTSNF